MNTLQALKTMRKGVLEQGYPSRTGEICHYWKHNRKCPIAMICPDEDLGELSKIIGSYHTVREEMYRPWMDGLDEDYMTNAQDLHDNLPDKGWLVKMVRGLDELIGELQ